MATDEQKPILLAFTKSQLTGKAEAACSNHIFERWGELKDFLKQNYSEKKHQGHLLMELQKSKQNPTETVSQFLFRIETALKKLLVSVQQNIINQVELEGRIASMNDLALHTFILNLRPEISQMLRAREIRTLNEAYNIALEEEKVQLMFRHQQNTKPKYCTFCHMNGHNSHECNRKFNYYKKNNISNEFAKIRISAHNEKDQNRSFDKFCVYCKHRGHLITE